MNYPIVPQSILRRYLSLVLAALLSLANRFKLFQRLVQRPARLVAACGLLVALTALPTHAQTCVPPPSGLVAWWPLNEQTGTKVNDIVGGHNGDTFNVGSGSYPTPAPIGVGAAALAAIKANTWNGGPVSIPGKVGNSLQFGFNIWAKVPNATDLNFGTGDFTIDAWVKFYNYNSSVGKAIVAKDDPYGGYILWVGTNFITGQHKLQLLIHDGTNGGTLLYEGPAITAPLETWIFVGVVRSGKTVTININNTGTALNTLSVTHGSNPIPIASSTNPLYIGQAAGNTGSDLAIDEVEIFNRALTQTEIQSIFNAGSAGKCNIPPKKGMTWLHTASNAQTGTITVGCGSSGPNPCDAGHGDTLCTQQLPLLCIYKPTPPFQLPLGLPNSNQYNLWSGGVVATTQPRAGNTFAHITDANSYCVAQFGTGWRAAEFHDGWGWNFQAYGGTVSAPAVPSTRFWVHINDQPTANCWATP